MVDITATKEKKDLNYNEIEKYTSESFVPLTIGGGINNIAQIRKLLLSGADKVCINSAAYNNSNFIKEASNTFGTQCIVISVDVTKTNSIFECYSHSCTRATGKELTEHCQKMESYGAGEILITLTT